MAQGGKSSTIFLVGSVFFFLLSFVGMGLAPWTTLKPLLDAAGRNPYRDLDNSALVKRGREVYIREGCWHCHTQFVRPVANEESRYGPVSQAWEAAFDVPHLYGTRRIGPDLAREAGRRPDDWHLAHLYDPRWTTPASIMPGYPWLFEPARGDSGPRPTRDALAMVAYLQQLGSARSEEIHDLVYPRVDLVEGAPRSTPEFERRGAELFAKHCQGCHGAAADGRGPGARLLNPPPENLTALRMPPEEAYRILAGGVEGSSMPSWRELSHYDLWALAHHTVSLHRGEDRVLAVEDVPDPPPATPERLAAGARSFAANCAVCHGPLGRAETELARALRPRPPDFTRQNPAPKWAFKVVTNGYGGAMPPWPLLSAEERWSLALFVSSLWAKGDSVAVAQR